MYTVVLDITRNGTSIGSTEDVFEAESADDATARIVAAWKALRPDMTPYALLVLEQQQLDQGRGADDLTFAPRQGSG
jgi:hypothetical protein